ncbi:MAG: hypothetical protein AUI10_04480 [Actinobacteria bacterium 13_2_20CM_2_72_6]|nr:MAG: hypothetical protein AUI10_04480 [Actinobacteria bacterium 13_2_20CM_2_72_6]
MEILDREGPYCADATAEEFFQLAGLRHYGYSDSALARLAPPKFDLGDRSRLDTTPTRGRVASLPHTLVAGQPVVDLATVAFDPGTTAVVRRGAVGRRLAGSG